MGMSFFVCAWELLGSALCLAGLSVQLLKLLWVVAGECTDQSRELKVMGQFGTVLV